MTQPESEPTKKPQAQQQSGSTGDDQAAGYQAQQGDYPAYSGRIAEATKHNEDDAPPPAADKQTKPKQ